MHYKRFEANKIFRMLIDFFTFVLILGHWFTIMNFYTDRNELLKEIIRQVQSCIKEKRYTIRELALLSGISKTVVGYLNQGKRNKTSIESLMKLSDFFGIKYSFTNFATIDTEAIPVKDFSVFYSDEKEMNSDNFLKKARAITKKLRVSTSQIMDIRECIFQIMDRNYRVEIPETLNTRLELYDFYTEFLNYKHSVIPEEQERLVAEGLEKFKKKK